MQSTFLSLAALMTCRAISGVMSTLLWKYSLASLPRPSLSSATAFSLFSALNFRRFVSVSAWRIFDGGNVIERSKYCVLPCWADFGRRTRG